MTNSTLSVSSMRDQVDAQAFHDLNERWIEEYFVMEDADRNVLSHPEQAITSTGGTVLIARDGDERVGCVALLRVSATEAELAKMAVTPARRGEGIGRLLLTAAIESARTQGLRRLLLESNSRLIPAVRMYESVGFQHVPAASHPAGSAERADVFMDLELI